MKTKGGSGRIHEIIKMIESGFFDKYKSSEEIKTELIRRGKRKLCKNIEVTLLRLVDQSKLDREKREINGKNLWVYKKADGFPSKEPKEFVFNKGSKYDFYTELKKIILNTKNELMVVDSYINEDIFDIYIKKLPKTVKIKILTNPQTPKGSFYKIACKFKSQHTLFEVRENTDCHDRIIFVDSDAWVFGQSIKAAGNKPTYLIRLHKSVELKKIFYRIWAHSKKIV